LRFLLGYLDPGNGSFLIQATVGAVLGVSYFARSHIKMIVNKFKRAPKKSDHPASD